MPDRMLRKALTALLWLSLPTGMHGQRGQTAPAGPPPKAKAAAPIDLTGYWVSVITEDWHERMLTAPKGDFGSGAPGTTGDFFGNFTSAKNPSANGNIPYNPEGEKAAMAWDPAKDEAEGNQCKAYGAAGVMRQPGRLHITWQDDDTLRMDTDAGTQTRIFHFSVPPAQAGQAATKPEPPAGEPTWQGFSVAEWVIAGGSRPDWPKGGNLKVVTTHLRPGYYWKNGMAYSGNAVITERFRVTKEDNGDIWLNFSQMVEDPQYLKEPYIITYHYKKQPDAKGWNPTPCSSR